MRFVLKVSIPVETGNAHVKAGKLGEVIQSILADIKPEAAYFTEMEGKRTGLIVVNLNDPSQIPATAEPFFLALNAEVGFHAAMVPEDLAKAGGDLDRCGKKYGW